MVNILELLLKLEDATWDGRDYCCPYCGKAKGKEHGFKCDLAQAILENGGETKLAPKE